jgi:hypothetical protein
MKKNNFLFALALVMGLGMSAFAQEPIPQSDQDVIVGKAEVVAQVVVTQLQDLIFGMVTPGNTKTISSAGAVIAGTAGTGFTIDAEKVGQFSVSKGLNTQVTLGFTLPTVLIYDLNKELPINFTDAEGVKLAKLTNFNGVQSDLLFTPGAGMVVENSGATQEYFADDDFKVFIGGTVVPAVGQVAGVYEGEITLTATYN